MKGKYVKPIMKMVCMDTDNILEASIEIDHDNKVYNPEDVMSKGTGFSRD